MEFSITRTIGKILHKSYSSFYFIKHSVSWKSYRFVDFSGTSFIFERKILGSGWVVAFQSHNFGAIKIRSENHILNIQVCFFHYILQQTTVCVIVSMCAPVKSSRHKKSY